MRLPPIFRFFAGLAHRGGKRDSHAKLCFAQNDIGNISGFCEFREFWEFRDYAKSILNFEFSRTKQMPKEPCYTDFI